MRKKLLLVTALAASGLASAQSSVTLFGALDLAYVNVKTNAGRVSGIEPNGYYSSKLGVRGVEDLGGGLSAGFWLEANVNPTNGANSSSTSSNNQTGNIAAGGLTFNRRSTVSLMGNFGELRMGRDFLASNRNYWDFEPFYNNSIGASVAAWANCQTSACGRVSNSIHYFLPANLGGIYGQLTYAFGNRQSTEVFTGTTPAYAVGQSTAGNGRAVGMRLGYASGPINTAVSTSRLTYAPGTASIFPLGIAGIPVGSVTDINWGGSYRIGPVLPMAFISRTSFADAGAPGNTAKVNGWNLAAIWYVFSADEAFASYGRATVSSALLATEPAATKWALGYRHYLSKRTLVYAHYAHVSNAGGAAQSAGSFSSGGLGAAGGAVNVNGRSTGIEFGMGHSF